jgi:polyhydroxyalkanoate synthesis regulator phasin
MNESARFQRLIEITLLFLTCTSLMHAQSLLSELKAEHDPAKRSEMALNFAENAFDNARAFYVKGEIDKGDAQLEDMTNVLNECVVSLAEAHKGKFYKKAELKVAYLLRRMEGLMDDIDLPQRGWAEQSERKVEEIHDKILDGVMRK